MARDLSQFKEQLDIDVHGMTTAAAIEQGICINCKQPPTFYSDDGRREYRISALCEPCFDEITKEEVPPDADMDEEPAF